MLRAKEIVKLNELLDRIAFNNDNCADLLKNMSLEALMHAEKFAFDNQNAVILLQIEKARAKKLDGRLLDKVYDIVEYYEDDPDYYNELTDIDKDWLKRAIMLLSPAGKDELKKMTKNLPKIEEIF